MIVFSGFILSGCYTPVFEKPAEKEVAFVTRVIDGDTITIAGGERVRLIGIDAPERGEDFYAEVKEFLESLILYRNVTLESSVEDRDRYGRLLRFVWINETLVNVLLVEKGYARALRYRETPYSEAIAAAEAKAIAARVGLWSVLEK